MWRLFEDGETLGQVGSKNGIIIVDEVYDNSCRITIEKGGCTAPFSISCGVYGLMCHTAFSKRESDVKSKYQNMKQELQAFIESNDNETDWCEMFTTKW
ncbi:MAG: hypothetical protein PHF63_14500 [Herbinix sp.]|nr:hypothetical protein [Herbinix sp.]